MPSAYITLDELRALKDALPHGAIESIAHDLAIPPEQVRAFLAAASLPGADPRAAIHAERGHAGGTLCAPHDDIIRAARNLLQQGEGVPTTSTPPSETPQGETLPEGTQGASSQESQMQDNLSSQASESQPIASQPQASEQAQASESQPVASAGSSAGASESQPTASQPQASEQAQASESQATVPGGPLRAKESPARSQANDDVAQPLVAEEEGTGFPPRPAWLEGLEGRMRTLEEQLEALLRGPVPGGREVPPAAGEGVTDSSLRARMRAEERARRG